MRRILLISLFLLAPLGMLLAQGPYKFAHIESQALLNSMPERDSAMAKLKTLEQELSDQMEQLQVELNKKYQDYMQKRETLTPSMRETKEKEITELQQRLQEYQVASERDFRDMQGKLMQPIVEKAQAAIRKVGKENGFLYVFDKSLGALLYESSESVDLLPMVQKELGIKPTAKK